MVSRGELPDASARLRVASNIDKTLFVEAGAGTGKTSSIVSRVVTLVRSGVPVDRIAAITFTEAAASELRTRVRDALSARGDSTNDRSLANAAGDVESAAFTTLHGFARRILAEYSIEAGLPPGFSVADEIGSALDFERAWREFVARVSDDMANSELLERASVLKVGLEKFPDIARAFDDNWDLIHTLEAPELVQNLDFNQCFEVLERTVALQDQCLFDTDKLVLQLGELGREVESIRRLDPIDQLAHLVNLSWPRRNVGRKDNWSTSLAEVRQEIESARQYVHHQVAGYQQNVIDNIVAMVADFVQTRVERRRKLGELSFHDLLVLARKLLRNNNSVRSRLHERYSRIVLDEFQDTDPIQIELAVLLATAEPEVGQRHWSELASDLKPGSLTVVGDPKQSIYRFRRADMAVYAAAERSLVETRTTLSTNFRSVPGVVDWINHLFGQLMGDGEVGVQPAYSPLSAYRMANHDAPLPVFCIGGPREENISAIRQQEASDVASVICAAMQQRWETERDGSWQPLQLADIAVLIPSRLSLPALEVAFDGAGVPYRAETSSLVYATEELREVLSGVRSVVDPTNAVDVVASLRSSLFAVGDNELLAWKSHGGSWDYRDPILPAAAEDERCTQIISAFATLSEWHSQRWWMGPVPLLEEIIRSRRLREQALMDRRARDRWRRYRFLLEQARHFTALYRGDLHDFVQWVDVQASDTARVVEPIPAETDDDSVRVLTIHGSKGLEFPMVIVAGSATQQGGASARVQALFPPNSPPQVRLGKDKTTKQYEVFASVEDALDASERVRLDYVAATRARDILVTSAYHKTKGRASSGKRIWESMQQADHLWSEFDGAGIKRLEVDKRPDQLRIPSGSLITSLSTWELQQSEMAEHTRKTRRWSVTAVAEALVSQDAGDENEPGKRSNSPPSSEEWFQLETDGTANRYGRRENGPHRSIGLAVHSVLQHVDPGDHSKVEGLVDFYCQQQGVGEQRAEVSSLVSMALSADCFKAIQSTKFWRELYVGMPTALGSVEGYVDLCYEAEDGLIVVDYKTSLSSWSFEMAEANRSEAEIDRRQNLHRYQLGCYSLILQTVQNRPVHQATILELTPTAFEQRPVDFLDEAQQKVADFFAT